MLIVIGFLVVIIAVLLYFSYVNHFYPAATSAVAERISRYAERSAPVDGEEEEASGSARLWRRLLSRASDVVEKVQKVKSFDMKLIQAGLPFRGAEFIVLSSGGSLVAGLLAFILSGGSGILGIVVVCAGVVGSLFWLKLKISQRQKRFNDQLSDAAGMIGNAMRSGFSFLQAVGMVSEEMDSPIAEEFGRIVRETSLGASIEESFANLRERVHSYDLDLFVTAVLIQREMGGNLASMMDTISQNIRDRIMATREMDALTAQGRLSGLVVGVLPLGVMAFIGFTNPSYYQVLFVGQIGYWCIGYAAVSYTVGMVLIKKITDVDF